MLAMYLKNTGCGLSSLKPLTLTKWEPLCCTEVHAVSGGQRGVGRKHGDRNKDGVIKCKYGKQSIFYLNCFLLFFSSHQISSQLESMSGILKTFNRRDSLY